MSCSFFHTDQQPPTITCPPDSSNGTDPERPTRTVSWNDPVVSDNSELHDANAAPTVVRSPNHITSPYDFPVGTTRITYTATDRSNLSSSCVFTVTVVFLFLILTIISWRSFLISKTESRGACKIWDKMLEIMSGGILMVWCTFNCRTVAHLTESLSM